MTLEEKIGYKFKNPNLFKLALKHRSIGKNSNERLEFLGDSVLSFIIAAELYYKYPKYREGDLSRLRSNLVKKDALADLAREFDLGEYIYLGVGEKKSGGFRRSSILADTLEAIIGAIYLDSNIENCTKIILSWYGDRLEHLTSEGQKDPKTELQEFLQARRLPLPIYAVTSTTGKAHKQLFHVQCNVPGFEINTQGQGLTKQEAEQNAAKEFLLKIQNEIT